MALQLQASPVGFKGNVPTLLRSHQGSARSCKPNRYDALQSASCFLISPSIQLLIMTSLPQQSRLKPVTELKVVARVASKGTYICRDCGYIYKDRTPFEKLPDKYFCPVCGAPKRRFKPYEPKVTKDANDTSVRKARKEQLKRDEAIGNALPFAVVLGVAALVGLYFYLNSAY